MMSACWTVIFVIFVLVLGYSLFKDDDWKR
jgi:hypothetical protein